jgi:hypothetical protein
VSIDQEAWPAEEPIVDQFLAALRDGVVDRWVKAGAESPGDPRATIAVQMGRQRYVVTLRGPAPTPQGAIYAEVMGGDEPMLGVITTQLAAVLDAAPETFRQKALVSAGLADLNAIALDGEGGPRRLVRGTWLAPRGGSFRFDGSTPEGSARVSAAALERLWEGIGKLQAEAFLSAGEADRALQRKVTIALSPKAGARTTIDVGGACPGHPDDVVAVRRDEHGRTDACVPRGALDDLTMPAAEMVDRRPVGARAEEVIDVRLTAGAKTIALARKGSEWHEQEPADRPVDADVGRAFVERLLDVTATKLAGGDAKSLGLDPPRATLRVTSLVPASGPDGGDAERVEQIEVGADQGGVVHVRRLEDGAIGEVPAEAAEALLPSEIALRPRKIYDTAFARFAAVRIETPGRTQRFARGADGSWSVVEPKGAGLVPDVPMLNELADALGGLTAERWVSATARPEHGLTSPRLVVTATLNDETDGGKAPTLSAAVGAPAGGAGSFARAGDDPAVFVASRRLEDAANRWLIDRTALVSEVSRVTRVTLTAPGGKRAVLEASGGAFHVAGAAADPVANAQAAAVREALADLVAEATVSVGRPEKPEGLDKPSLEAAVEIAGKTVRIRFGAGDSWKGTSVVYARKDGVDATFAVAQAKVRPLFAAAGIER